VFITLGLLLCSSVVCECSAAVNECFQQPAASNPVLSCAYLPACPPGCCATMPHSPGHRVQHVVRCIGSSCTVSPFSSLPACLPACLLYVTLPHPPGHRVQHESKFLWRLHSKHHAIDTPSPFSTLFIDPTDAALQVRPGSLITL
jgi:hypothetical protein